MTHRHVAPAVAAVPVEASVLLVGNSNVEVGRLRRADRPARRRLELPRHDRRDATGTVRLMAGTAHWWTRLGCGARRHSRTTRAGDARRVAGPGAVRRRPGGRREEPCGAASCSPSNWRRPDFPVVICLNMTDEAEARDRRTPGGSPTSWACPWSDRRRSPHRNEHLREAIAEVSRARTALSPVGRRRRRRHRRHRSAPSRHRRSSASARARLPADDDTLVHRLELDPWSASAVRRVRAALEAGRAEPVTYALTRRRLAAADAVLSEVVRRRRARGALHGRDERQPRRTPRAGLVPSSSGVRPAAPGRGPRRRRPGRIVEEPPVRRRGQPVGDADGPDPSLADRRALPRGHG